MARLLILTNSIDSEALPAIGLLSHEIHRLPPTPAHLVDAPSCDLLFIDARHNLASAKALCKILTVAEVDVPFLLVLTEGGLAAVSADWGAGDVILDSAGPAEVEARIRLILGKNPLRDSRVEASGVTIDEANYSAKAHGRTLDLTFKEFELLRFFATHCSRVFTREQLLSEVWGSDYFGGSRTVDVHVRRLRAKLGDLESLIETVRNVGYRFTVSEKHEQSAS